MDQSQLSSRVADAASMSRTRADAAVSALFEAIADALAAGESIAITGFDTFGTRQRAPRTGRTPRTGGAFRLPPRAPPRSMPSTGSDRNGITLDAPQWRIRRAPSFPAKPCACHPHTRPARCYPTLNPNPFRIACARAVCALALRPSDVVQTLTPTPASRGTAASVHWGQGGIGRKPRYSPTRERLRRSAADIASFARGYPYTASRGIAPTTALRASARG